jgi:hypothetical protein
MDKKHAERKLVEKEQRDLEREEAGKQQATAPDDTGTEPREDRESPQPFSGSSR